MSLTSFMNDSVCDVCKSGAPIVRVHSTARHTERPMLVPISFFIVGRVASAFEEKVHLGGGTRFRVNNVFTQGLCVYSG
jgi:hypothetical protein